MRQKIQKFGRALSSMVMPNIGAFIAWGLITALFIPTGWMPNEHLGKLVDPMLKYLLPLLIAYTGGRNVAGDRGAVIGAIAAMGVIIGSDIPMFIGAMLMGPFAAWCIKKFDSLIAGKVRAGFEMLVNNFSIGIIGFCLAILGYLVIGDVITLISKAIGAGADFIIQKGLLPLISFVVEPAKVLFLNNAVHHGILAPIGIEQASHLGQSIIFLVDPNPGPGLGLLLAFWLLGKGVEKESAPGSIIIHFFGGIHEVYFPYVLAKPVLILAMIAGSSAGLLFFSIFDAGLVSVASPGSIITTVALASKGKTLLVLTGILLSAAVSFLVAAPFIRGFKKKEEEIIEAEETAELELANEGGKISKIIFACDAGMGSSALGATRFRQRIQKAGFNGIHVSNTAANSLPDDADAVVCQKMIADRLVGTKWEKKLVVITNFLSDPQLDKFFEVIEAQETAPAETEVAAAQEMTSMPEGTAPITAEVENEAGNSLLLRKNIIIGLAPESKEEAIRRAGRLLADSGYVEPSYADAMIDRENLATTYMGMGLAIPHGTSEAKEKVLKSGICVLQYPEGVDFGEEKARFVIGIAGVGDAHLEILSKLAETLEDEELLEKLMVTEDPEEIYKTLN